MTGGRVYLVGGGPGDPGLLTLRGRDALGRADVVVYDALVSERLLAHAPAESERIYVGKRAGQHSMPQDKISALLVERARAGQTVVRLKGGDPFVFGRGGEEAVALSEAGVGFEVVPGVTAGVAAPAFGGIPVTHRDAASAVAFITGHEADERADSALDWEALARFAGTLVFYMGVGKMEAICRRLVENGLDPETPAAAIRWGTTPRQRTVVGTAATLPGAAREAGIEPPAVVILGEVVRLRDRLAWFERRPLFGRRIAVTRARAQASRLAAALEELGAEAIEAPAIRIEPPEDPERLRVAVASCKAYDWIVFTSVNGVAAFFDALNEMGLDTRALAGRKIAAIGPATADRLAESGVLADCRPDEYTTAGIVAALAERLDLRGAKVLCPRADIAPPDLADALGERGAVVDDVAAYRTVPDDAGGDVVAERLERGEIDWVTFTSSSTVRNFLATAPAGPIAESGVRVASIGPVTSATLREAGLEPTVEADPHTIPALIDAIVEYEK
jgi:uroporphyrinogen III methyltransferase/synthase